MKRFAIVIAAGAALAAWLGTGCAKKTEKGVTWLRSMDEGKKASVAGQKPLVVYYSADWSDACGKFEGTVLIDPAVEEKLGAFVAVRIDGDVDEDTPKQYNVAAYPTTIFYYPNGDEVKRVVGAVSTNDFLKLLADVQAGKIESEKQLLAREAKSPTDYKLVYDIASYYVTTNRPERARPRFEKIITGDPDNKTGLIPGVLTQLGFIELTAQQPEAAIERFKTVTDKYPVAPEVKKCYVYLGDAYQLLEEPDEAVTAYNVVVTKYPGTPEADEAQTKMSKLTMLEKTVEAFTSRTPTAITAGKGKK